MPPDERVLAINALFNTASLILHVASYSQTPRDCPHGNCRTTSRNAWYCDECFGALATALARLAALRSGQPPPLLKAWADTQDLHAVQQWLALCTPCALSLYPNDNPRRVPIAIDRLDMRPLQ